jgi:hypothetical protein
MAQGIQRLRYFDGEYLRSNDFTDEQSYHVAMRRWLNLQLHLSGIAYGLEIQQDANSVPPNALFFAVSPGFAIDQLGREIVVSAPYELSTDNVLGRAGLQSGRLYEVWIVYTETASGLPAPGYQLCDQPGQNTRWTESFDIRLKPKGAPPSTTGDDPNTDLKGVLLGHVTVVHNATIGWTITNRDTSVGRTYVGIRAQSIIMPDQVDPDTSVFTAQNITPPTASAVAPLGYLDVGPTGPLGGPGVLMRGNIFGARNLVVGDDYLIQNADGSVPNLFNPINGNLKLNSDLFLQGTIHTFDTVKRNWVPLSAYIASISASPLIQFLTAPVTFSGATSDTKTASASTPPSPANYSSVIVQASINGLTFVPQPAFNTYANGTTGTAVNPSITLGNILPAPTTRVSAGQVVPVSVDCTLTGDTSLGSFISGMSVLFVVVFQP